jgi:protein gp37
MGEVTHISWCDHTWNPVIGCAKVSPACDGCYAENLMDKRYHRVDWGKPGAGAGERVRTSAHTWNDPARWNRKAERDGTRPFVFCSSLSDVFDNQWDPQWRADAFKVMRDTPRLIYLLLTKRPQLITKLALEAGGLPSNAAIGTTIEDQKRADLNVPHLIRAKHDNDALFAFLSCEPLLEHLDLEYPESLFPGGPERCCGGFECGCQGKPTEPPLIHYIDWVITGGETDQGAHRARPTHPGAFRSLRDQCAQWRVPYHHKQNGEWVSVSEVEGPGDHFKFPDGATVRKVGKGRSGRTINGVVHDAFPVLRR